MTQAIKCDNAAADAYVTFNAGAGHAVFYLEAGFYVPAALLASISPSGFFFPRMLTLRRDTAANMARLKIQTTDGLTWDEWQDSFNNDDIAAAVLADAVNVGKAYWNTGAMKVTANSVDDVTSQTSTRLGQFGDFGLKQGDSPGVLYITYIKVGTSEGGADLLDFDAATASDLSAFSVVGDATLAELPTPPVPPANVGQRSPEWRFVVGDLQTFETLSFLDRLASRRVVTPTLNAPWPAEMVVPSDNPEINIPWPTSGSDPFLTEGSRVLWGFRKEGDLANPPVWRIRYSGMVLQLEDTAQSDIAYSHLISYDPWQYLFSRPVCNADGTLPGPGGISFTATRVDVIVGELLLNTIVNQGGVGIDAGALYGGTGFYVGTIESLPTIDINFAQGTTLGAAWKQLCDANYCDLVLLPIYDPINRPGYLSELNVYAQAGAAKDDAIFAWDKPSRSLVGINRLYEGNQRADVVKYFAGQGGSATGGQTIVEQRDTAAIAKFGEYWRQQFFPNQTVAAAVLALAQAQLALSKNGRVTVAISPAAERSPIPFTDYFLGDRVPVYASQRFRAPIPQPGLAPGDAQNYQRIYAIPIEIADDTTEQVRQLLTALP